MALIRLARIDDAPAILAVYAPFVCEGAVSFEYEVPSLNAFRKRMQGILSAYPCLVFEDHGKVLAYTYASRHRERAAYAWNVETAIYSAPQVRGKGVGRGLYETLFGLLRILGYCNAYAIIALPGARSLAFHRAMGFRDVGVHRSSGYKFGIWHDVAWLEKRLFEPKGVPAVPRPVSGLSALELEEWRKYAVENCPSCE